MIVVWWAMRIGSLRPVILLATWVIIRSLEIRRDLMIIHAGVGSHMNIVALAGIWKDLTIIAMSRVRAAVPTALLTESWVLRLLMGT